VLKKITFSADEEVIAKARETAAADGKTLNEIFREWLAHYAGREERRKAIEAFFETNADLNLGGRKFTREEMNERR